MTDVLIVSLLGFLVAMIAVMSPIFKLNSSITTLNCNLKALADTIRRDEGELKELKGTVAQHELEIGNAKKDIKLLYKKAEDLERKE